MWGGGGLFSQDSWAAEAQHLAVSTCGWSVGGIPSASPGACRHRRGPHLSRLPSVSGAMTPQPWGLLCAHSSGTASRMSSPSYRGGSPVRWGARGATALCTLQLCENRQKLLGRQIQKKAEFTREDKPSITLGRKCAAPLFFFTLLPFMI